MQANRFWIEILALGTAIACALALVLATLGVAAAAFAAQAQTSHALEGSRQVLEGMVTCSRCGAKHSPAIGESAGDCTRRCVHAGSSFALVDGDHSYALDGDLMLLKKIAGQRARIVGTIHGNTIKVISVATT
jgi:hypothetical protein